jgi:V-ATPase subunit H
MTRWDVYVAEVKSGHLKWGIVHTEKFFRDNARRMEGKDGNFEIVKVRPDGGQLCQPFSINFPHVGIRVLGFASVSFWIR